MPSKLNIKRNRVTNSGWLWYKDEGMLYALHKSWHWSSDHIPFRTERDLINKLYKSSFPTKHVELTITVG